MTNKGKDDTIKPYREKRRWGVKKWKKNEKKVLTERKRRDKLTELRQRETDTEP